MTYSVSGLSVGQGPHQGSHAAPRLERCVGTWHMSHATPLMEHADPTPGMPAGRAETMRGPGHRLCCPAGPTQSQQHLAIWEPEGSASLAPPTPPLPPPV